MPKRQLATVVRRQWTGIVAIALTAVASVAPASFAQDARVLDQGKSAGAGMQADQRPALDGLPDGVRPEAQAHPGVYIAVPIGKVRVGPEFVEGEPVYVRRTKVSAGMTIVEVSKTPFAPVLGDSLGAVASTGIPADQPTGW